MLVVFRADASVTIGTGHVMRCLTLADTLRARGADCQFVTRDQPGHLGALIAERGFAVSILDAPSGPALSGPPDHAAWAGVTWQQDLADTRAAIDRADWLIVDHYALDARWQQGLGDRVGRIMVIDDLADRPHAAALLLDQNLGREAKDYDGLVPDDCRILTGPRFALLRPEFAAQREASLARRKGARLAHLMISMGGTDAADATSMVLRALARADLPSEMRISVVMGSCAPALECVRALAADMPWPTRVLVDVRDMGVLMAEADLAIGAGGSTTWERCCLGLPSVIVETAANQAGAVAAMEDAAAALGTGPLADPAFGERLVAAVWQAGAALGEISTRAAGICNGQGASRVADALQARALTVRRAGPEDARDVWHWRNDGAASSFYLKTEPTPLDVHLEWFEKALGSDWRDLLIVEVDGLPAGHVRFDRDAGDVGKADVGICLNPDLRGQGLGSRVLSAACDWALSKGVSRIFAQIHKDNIASQKVFDHAGFEPSSLNGEFGEFVLEFDGENPPPDVSVGERR